MDGYRIGDEAVNQLLRAVLNGSDADAINMADALLESIPADAVVLTVARAAVQRRGVEDWGRLHQRRMLRKSPLAAVGSVPHLHLGSRL